MDNIFRREAEVHFYDCDPQSRMKISAALRLLADMADAHYAARGMDHKWLWDNGFVFLVSRVSVQFARLPRPHEQLMAETWEREIKGASFLRDFAAKDAGGGTVMTASTAWMLVDPASWQVLRPSQFPNAQPTGLAAGCPPCRRLKMPGGEPAGERQIRYSDLDANGHVYNAVYSDIALDVLPEGWRKRELARFQINFVHQALEGETIQLYREFLDDSTVSIKGTVGDHDCFLCEFGYREPEF